MYTTPEKQNTPTAPMERASSDYLSTREIMEGRQRQLEDQNARELGLTRERYLELRDLPPEERRAAMTPEERRAEDLANEKERRARRREMERRTVGRLGEPQRFSLRRAIMNAAGRVGHHPDDAEAIELGREEFRASGLGVPHGAAFVMPGEIATSEARAMSVLGGTGGNQGGMTVETNKAGLIDDLFASVFVRRAGAMFMGGLVGNLDLPRLIADDEPDHKAENATADESSPTTAQLSLNPKRLPTYIDISNQLLLQSSDRNFEALIRKHLERKLAVVMEKMFIAGTGASNQPRGILHTAGIGAVIGGTNGAAPTLTHLSNLIREVANENAVSQSGAFAINSATAAKLRITPKFAGTDSLALLDDRTPGMLSGYPYHESNVLPSNLTKGSGADLSAIIFGSWADFVIAQWSGIEFIADSVTKAAEGMTRIHAAVYYDGGVLRPQSFAAMLDAKTD